MDQHSDEQNTKKWMAPFFTIWGGQALSLLGSQLVQFALIWWLTKTTGSATVLATASLVGLLPQVFLGPVAGALIDRWSRRVIIIAADSLVALATLGLALLFWMGDVQIVHIYLLMFVRALAGGVHWSAMQATTSLMVPEEHLSRIQGLNQTLNGAMNIGAAPLGALLLELMPMQGILAIDVGTAGLAILPLLFISIPQPERISSEDGKTTVWQDVKAGLAYVWGWPGLMMIMALAMLINVMITPAFALVPILVTKHFGGQAFELAWLESAAGLGIVVGGLVLSAWGGFRRRVVTSYAGLVLLGAAMALIGLTPAAYLWLAVGLVFLVGFTLPMIDGPLLAVVQTVVEPDMQGRVLTLLLSAAKAMTPLALIIAGPVADAFGVRSWFFVGGIITVFLGFGALFVPAIMGIEDDKRRKELPTFDAVESEASLTTQPIEASGG